MDRIFVVIGGADSRLGQELVKRFLQRQNHTVIAIVGSSQFRTGLISTLEGASALGSILLEATHDGGDWPRLSNLHKLVHKCKIPRLDIVIAIADTARHFPHDMHVKDVRPGDIGVHVEANVSRGVALYRASRGLLRKSNRPIFTFMGSGTSALCTHMPPIPNALYGASISMVNFYGVKIHQEDTWLTCFVMDVGWIHLGETVMPRLGCEEEPGMIDLPCEGMLKVLDNASRAGYGGKLVKLNGAVEPW